MTPSRRVDEFRRVGKKIFLALTVCAVALLVACAPVRVRETPAAQAAQATREARLATRNDWIIAARIAVSNGNDGGSGDLIWTQHGDRYSFTVHAPVTGRTWKLSGDAQGAELEGLDSRTYKDTEPERLLHDRLGWDVPLAQLGAWIKGMRAGGTAQVQYDADNLPAVIEQTGWKVEYRDWLKDRDPPLPRKVFASRGHARVRVAIESWDFASQ